MPASALPHPAARALIDARRRGEPVASPEVADAPTAYAVQDEVARALGWFADAAPRVWKSGGPSRTAPRTHAPLPPDGVLASPADASTRRFHRRFIEAEIALRLGRDVDAAAAAAADRAGLEAMIDAMCVSIEIVDSRWVEGLAAPAFAKLADLQSHGALVLGDWVPFARRDWSAQPCRVRIGDRPPAVHRGTHPMADPASVLQAWLRHAILRWGSLAAGTVVTTGSWCGMLEASPGDRVDADFEGIGAACVRL